MDEKELEQRVAEIRASTLRMICKPPYGELRIMTLDECRRTGSSYVHIVEDELDALLSAELGGNGNR